MPETTQLFGRATAPKRLPSSSITEQAILGAVLANNRTFTQAETLRPEHFSDPMYGSLFAEIARRVIANQLADPVTLRDWVIANTNPAISPRDAADYLVSLVSGVVSFDIKTYVEQLKEQWTRRQISTHAEALLQAANDTNVDIRPFTVQVGDAIDAVLVDQSDAIDISFDAALDKALHRIRTAKARGSHGGLVLPAMPRTNRRIAFLPQQLTVLGGQSGEGKSAIAWQWVVSIAEHIREQIEKGRPRSDIGGIVGLSFEMSAESLANRALSAQTGIAVEFIETNIMTDDQIAQLEAAQVALAKLPIRLIALGGMTPAMMRMRMRQARRKLGGRIALTVIDHVQLVEADDNHAKSGGAWATGKVADAILYMSKEFNTHVLALSQVDIKDIAKRTEKRPTRADLRWSANFAANADNILFVHRPEAHIPKAPPTRESGEPDGEYAQRVQDWHDLRDRLHGKAELIGDKVRNGSSNWVIPLYFDGPTTSFSEDPTHDYD